MNINHSVKIRNHRTNWPVTILLTLGCVTIFFPLYMTVIIAFKKPSEMTNDILGALLPPVKWSLSNFSEAMKVTNFWQSLGYSVLITLCTVALSIVIHSLAGYVIGRNMARKKFYKFAYFYMISGMFVPFAILMMPEIKQTAIPNITRRRSYKARNGVFLHVLGHINTDHVAFVVEQSLGQRFGKLGFANAGRTEEKERANRAVRILDSGAGTKNRFRNHLNSLFLPYHALMQNIAELD